MAWNPPRGIFGPQNINASGVSGAIIPPLGNSIYLILNVFSMGGLTPSLTMGIQWSHDGGTNWATGDPAGDTRFSAFGALSAPGSRVKAFSIAGTLYRLNWTFTGVGQTANISLSEYTTV